jgi:hypothetical protein
MVISSGKNIGSVDLCGLLLQSEKPENNPGVLLG